MAIGLFQCLLGYRFFLGLFVNLFLLLTNLRNAVRMEIIDFLGLRFGSLLHNFTRFCGIKNDGVCQAWFRKCPMNIRGT